MASDGQVVIDLLFPGNKADFHSDIEWVNDLLNKLGVNTGDKMDSSFKNNTENIKSSAKETKSTVDSESEKMGNNAGNDMGSNFKKNTDKMNSDSNEAKNKVNRNLDDIKKEVRTKLVASAEEAGIKNFKSLLSKMPKEEVTKLEAKVEKGEEINWREEMSKMPKEIVTKMKLDGDQATVGLSRLKEEADNTGKHFTHLKEIIVGSFVGQAISNGIQAIVSGLKEATAAGIEYNKEQDTMKTVWTSLTTEAPKDGKELVSYINSLSSHSIYAADTINKMAQSFYHVHSSVSETKDWTNSFVALGSTLHMTNDALAESGEQFAKIVAGGKASAEDMSVMINRFPMFGEALQQATGKSMKQLYAMSAAGKLTATQFTEALDYLGKKYQSGTAEAMTSFMGMSMYIKSRWETLWGDITKTSFNMSKKARGDIRDLLSDDMLKTYANAVSGAIASITGWVTNLLDYINGHKKTIIDIIGNLKILLGIIGQTVWKTFIDFVYEMAKAFGLVSDKGKGTADPLKQIDDILKALIEHKQGVVDVTKALIAFFMIKKATDFLSVLSNMKGMFAGLITKATEFAGIDLFSGGGSAAAGTVAKEAEATAATETVASTASKTGLLAGASGLVSKIGASSLVKSTPYLAGAYETYKGVTENSSTGGKVGGGTGAIAGTAAGAALGSLILPGIGTAIGAGAGAWVGEKFGSGFGKSIQDSLDKKKLKVHVITPKVKVKVSADTKDLQKSVSNSVTSLNKVIAKPSFNSADLAKERTATLKNYQDMQKAVDTYYSKKKQSAINDLNTELKNGSISKSEYNKQYKEITDYYNKEATSKKKSINQMIKDSTNYHNQVAKIENNSNLSQKQKQAELLKLHGDYVNQMVKDEANLNTKVKAQVQKGAKEQKSIYEQLIKEKGKLNEKDLNATQKEADKKYKAATAGAKKEEKALYKSAEDEYKSQKKAADDSYNLTVKMAEKNRDARKDSAERQYKDLHTISKSQYEDLKKQADDDYSKAKSTAESKRKDTVSSAKQQRDQTKDAAWDQYTNTTKTAREEHEKVSDETEKQRKEVTEKNQKQKKDVVDTAWQQSGAHGEAVSGEMTTVNGKYSDGFGGVRTVINAFIDGFNDVLNALHKGWGKIPDLKKHATGSAGLLQDELALVGEEGFELAHDTQHGIYTLGSNGPEVRSLKAGTSILPHEQSKKFLQMTSLIPHHASGVMGTISNVYDWVKDKIGDVSSLVEKGASGAVNWIADKVGLNGFLNKFDTAQYSMLKGTSDLGIKDFTSYLKGFFKKYDDEVGNIKGTATPEQAKEVIQHAMGIAGVSGSNWLNGLETIAKYESGFRNVTNNWDSNAKAGHPSSGWFQMIESTFKAHAKSGYTTWTNPLDQAISAIGYIESRYGGIGNVPGIKSLAKGGKYVGYANGGFANEPSIFGEDGLESAVPLSANKIDQSYAALGKTAAYIAARDNLQTGSGNAVTSQQLSSAVKSALSNLGSITLNNVLDGKTIATLTYSIQKAMQASEINVIGTGTAIPVGGGH
ncbi:tape measure protein [Liquorilactobacillus mali]|uniref:tape measure protein n=3 Tax=Liquorilactobacillus mali TaxID=1618 RepID=UPI0002492A30|nr:tape measure protein [Liquorilactobacillus mali]EJE97693.1 phage tape measure protein [Liquorilactobacillus mali KCTC 3596 = DSM 20444]QFQ75142.1 tape measure protein [Liquorilactobacillus mali]